MFKIQCSICKSSNVEILETEWLNRTHKKTVGNVTTTSHEGFPINKYVCFDCGLVSKQMPEEARKSYIEARPYFVR